MKFHSNYYFECNITEKPDGEYDEWGAAICWIGDFGAEYNWCYNGENCSAIYKMENAENPSTDTDKFIHYEIDFNKRTWKKDLENVMCDALIKLHELN